MWEGVSRMFPFLQLNLHVSVSSAQVLYVLLGLSFYYFDSYSQIRALDGLGFVLVLGVFFCNFLKTSGISLPPDRRHF